MIGHNGCPPSFDEAVKESLERGVVVLRVEMLEHALTDPRLNYRHRVVLAELSRMMNNQTGMAFPGHKLLAERASKFLGEVYAERTIANVITDLKCWGYLLQERRAPVGGGRALSHYAIRAIQTELFEQAIIAHLAQRKSRSDVTARRDITARDDVILGRDVTASDVTTREDVSVADVTASSDIRPGTKSPDVTAGSAADVTAGGGTVTSRGTRSKNPYSPQVSHPTLDLPMPPPSMASPQGAVLPEVTPPTALKPRRKRPSMADMPTDEILPAFEAFWREFPEGRKVDKARAFKAFRKILKRDDPNPLLRATVDDLMIGVRGFRADRKWDRKFAPQPATWLNRGQWHDYTDRRVEPSQKPGPTAEETEAMYALMRQQECGNAYS